MQSSLYIDAPVQNHLLQMAWLLSFYMMMIIFMAIQQGEDKKLGQEKTNHAVKDREMDDNGDFLHQIRTKVSPTF